MEYRKKIRPLRVKLLDGSAKTVLVGINDNRIFAEVILDFNGAH